jgi:hypothetical protein
LHETILADLSCHPALRFAPGHLELAQSLSVVAASLVLWMLVTYAWPAHLEEEIEGSGKKERAAEEDAR